MGAKTGVHNLISLLLDKSGKLNLKVLYDLLIMTPSAPCRVGERGRLEGRLTLDIFNHRENFLYQCLLHLNHT